MGFQNSGKVRKTSLSSHKSELTLWFRDKEKGLSELSKISQNAIDRIGFFHSSKRVASTNLREQRDARAQVTKGGLPYDKNEVWQPTKPTPYWH